MSELIAAVGRLKTDLDADGLGFLVPVAIFAVVFAFLCLPRELKKALGLGLAGLGVAAWAQSSESGSVTNDALCAPALASAIANPTEDVIATLHQQCDVYALLDDAVATGSIDQATADHLITTLAPP